MFAHCLTSDFLAHSVLSNLCTNGFVIHLLSLSLLSFSSSLGWHSQRETNVPSRTTGAEFAWALFSVFILFSFFFFSLSLSFQKCHFMTGGRPLISFDPTMISSNSPRWVNCEEPPFTETLEMAAHHYA